MFYSFSSERIKCVDYLGRHKRIVYKTKYLRLECVGNLVDEIQRIVGPSVPVNRNDNLCNNCVAFYKRNIVERTQEEIPIFEDSFIPEDEIVEVLNTSIKTFEADMSPFKVPSQVRPDRREGYVKRKKLKLEETLTISVMKKVEDIYGVCTSKKISLENPDSSTCNQWFSNIDTALQTCGYNEKVQLLTLVPRTFSKTELNEKLPTVSKYLIDKSRRITKERGIYVQPDAYSGHPLLPNVLNLALSYYLDDDKDCTRDSPNKNDVVYVKDENGEKVKKVKRFMTRSIKEAYQLMKKDNQAIKISLSKFYTLHPKYVKIQPIQVVCSCVYCSNLKLVCIALKNITHMEIVEEHLLLRCLCNINNEDCWLQDCGECPGTEALKAEVFGLEEEEEVTYAIWEGGDLIKKSLSIKVFLKDVRLWVNKAIPHNYIRKIQREEIAKAKTSVKQKKFALVLHFDFAENWSVILPDEIQSYHWKNIQISLFTCVAYFGEDIKSFVVVSDDITHDTSHALCAIDIIRAEIFKLYQLEIESFIYISDGAAGHFKNKYQLYELSKRDKIEEKKWIFSATGHGKSACDAIGGLCKHYATNYNLQREPVKAIRDATSFVSSLSELIKNIELRTLDRKTIQNYRLSKEKEWVKVKPVVGIQSKHYWLVQNSQAYMGRTIRHKVKKVETSSQEKKYFSITDFDIGEFVGCIYDNNWWMAQITSVSRELKDITVSFMYPHGPAKGFQWPEESGKKKDECPVPLQNVLLKVKDPTPFGLSARLHTFNEKELRKIEEIYCL